MKSTLYVGLLALISSCMLSCNDESKSASATGDTTQAATRGSYAFDLDFLKKHNRRVLELSNEDGNARVVLSADYQGRVMTSTASGDSGISFGWLNYDLIASGEKKKQFNPVGGEERFWLGPEGGQYSIYFKGKDSFSFVNWQVPPVIDTVEFDVETADKTHAKFVKTASVTNYSGTVFDILITRTISLLNRSSLEERLGSIPADIRFVAYETENSINNAGTEDWTKNKGLLSIWLLGMFTPSPETEVIIPFNPRADARKHITDDYFGKIPAGRLKIKDSVIYFQCDGRLRSKIGISPVIAKPIAAAIDLKKNVMTVVIPTIHPSAAYVNSKWEIQDEPYKGDVINSYNDGPLADGTQMGPFFEIESSSPAFELKKGETGTYRQVTCHFEGSYESLRTLGKQLLGVDFNTIKP